MRDGGFVLDERTIKQYADFASTYVAEWTHQTPVVVRQLVSKWFTHGSVVLDIGSGSGRDVSWLWNNGYKTQGVDASIGLLNSARLANPGVPFTQDSLPLLAKISSVSVDNVLCTAVLMHLPVGEIAPAAFNMLRVLRVGGRLICSVRPSRESEPREADGRLYTSIEPEVIAGVFRDHGAVVLEAITSDGRRADTIWHTVVIEKS